MGRIELGIEKDALIETSENILELAYKLKERTDIDKKYNARNGYFEFAYIEYFLSEIISLIRFSIYIMKSEEFDKYTHYPARSMMEIVLEMEHIFSLKKAKGNDAVRREFFKNITSASKSALSLPEEAGKDRIERNLALLDVASKIMKLDFKTVDVSEKSSRNIKSLCEKSSIIIMGSTGSDLYYMYMFLSDPAHANVLNVGVKSFDVSGKKPMYELKINLELAIRFVELVATNCSYNEIEVEVNRLKTKVGLKS